MEEAKEWNISPNEIQTSFDVVNLYPSVPIDEAVAVIIEILNNDIDDLRKRTKLTLTDIQKLIELCLSSNYFIFDNPVRVLKNSGPIGLALMIVISEAFLQRLEEKAIQETLATNLAPLTYRRYVDDSHARFETVHQSHSFLNILNKQNRAIQYTMEKEDQSQKLNFLDVTIINTGAGKIEFKIHRKNAITNVQIKPHSFVNSSLIRDIFKGFVSRAKRLCSGKYLDEDLNFLVDMFVENGHGQNYLNSIINENKHQAPNTENKDSNIVQLPWIPLIGPKIRKELQKTGCKVIFTSATKLKNILCNNKSKLLLNSYPGVYELSCDCGGKYIGETKKRVLTRSIEHQEDIMTGKWEVSGTTEHSKDCHGRFNWLHPKTLAKLSIIHKRKIRESLEINNLETKAEYDKSIKVLNRDRGNIVNTNSWKPLFRKINMVRHANVMK